MKVTILTLFSSLPTTYSLVNVVDEQLKMLLEHDVEVTLIVAESCRNSERHGVFRDDRICWRFIPHHIGGRQIKLYNYAEPDGTLHETFQEEADFFATAFEEVLGDADVCILHDILYQGWLYVYNIALRKAQKKLPHLRFLAFAHSYPARRPSNISHQMAGRYTGMENTLFIYPARSGLEPMARQYNVSETQCRTVYNSVPLLDAMCPEVQALHREVDLLSPEILMVYPGRFTVGKKFEKAAALAGAIKTVSGKSVRAVFCTFPGGGMPEADYKAAIRIVSAAYGLAKEDLIFTSEHGFPTGFPRQGVLDLFSLSNLFVCPSYSEACPLNVLEAAGRGNFLVLNRNVPALEELGELCGAYFMEWGARRGNQDLKPVYPQGEMAYVLKEAIKIAEQMARSGPVRAKTMTRVRFNRDWIWKHQLGPLLTEEPLSKLLHNME